VYVDASAFTNQRQLPAIDDLPVEVIEIFVRECRLAKPRDRGERMNDTVGKIVILSLLACGCGGDKSPREKCDDLFSLICDRAVSCIPGASGMHEECMQAFDQTMVCAKTMSVAPGYDHCVDGVEQASCQTLVSVSSSTGEPTIMLPAECNGVMTGSTRGDLEVHATAPLTGPFADLIRAARAMAE
jgi:hypothetical protein